MVTILTHKCLGNANQNFLDKIDWTQSTSLFDKFWTLFWGVVFIAITSNIPDLYFNYSCMKKMQEHDENLKSLVSKNEFIKRKR